MNENKNHDLFQPDFNAPFFERFDKFKAELVFWADGRYKHYFDGRNDFIDNVKFTHRLWNYIQPDVSKNGGKSIAVLFLKKGSQLPDEMVNFFDQVFIKHFPTDRHPMMHTVFV